VAPDFRHAVSTLEELHDHVLLNVEIHGVQRDLHGSASSSGAEAIEHVRQIRFPSRIDHNAQKPASHSAQPRGKITLPLVAAATVPGADYEIGEILFDGTYDVGDLCGIMRTVGIHEHLDLAGGFPDSHLIRITLAAAVVQDNTSSSLLRRCCGFILGMTVDDDNLFVLWFDGRDETAGPPASLRAQMITLMRLAIHHCSIAVKRLEPLPAPRTAKNSLGPRAWSRPRAFAIATSNHAAPAELES
jgi:hypothetical protein